LLSAKKLVLIQSLNGWATNGLLYDLCVLCFRRYGLFLLEHKVVNKSVYQQLRFSVENQIADHHSGNADSCALVNSLMRVFLQAMATEQVKRQVLKRDMLTFRRDPKLNPPSWAYREPDSNRLPTL